MKAVLRLSALLLLLPLLFSCVPSEAGSHTTAAPPKRVAVLFSSLCEIWQEAGGTVAITVGESVERGIIRGDVTLVDRGAGKAIHTELLIASAPELVIYSPDIPAQVTAAELCERAGIPTLPLRVESFADYCAAVATAVAITGRDEALPATEAARAEVTRLLCSEASERVKGETFLFIRAGQTAASTKVKRSEEHFAAGMLTELGLVNIADSTPAILGTLSTEAILAADPDCLFFSLMGDAEGATAGVMQLLSRPEWQALRAVRLGRVYILPRELFHFKPCARWPEAYAYLLNALDEGVSP